MGAAVCRCLNDAWKTEDLEFVKLGVTDRPPKHVILLL